ncbi:VirB4 family type IV secretion/conjugal transfer ATPase [Salmonella enterica]|nr:VirB4 family type IV secretion/conjugal transfer ATPase [Salmonella enterica]EEP3373109.1 VirB4 family type IV secretion/conjugal transfer ATPase [Salmonella enterica]EFP6579669.1 VirB4 family type IV secretion/conjugal transfer ATPase [Salmonella enterica]EGC7971436.1 VirB4 family type IV secretion/conjugal transfer ATPase [Salmonella enterica]EIV4461661.1 VirB4 family type IV secretion/conjugal transfer ATPase [Salmonella enterica]
MNDSLMAFRKKTPGSTHLPFSYHLTDKIVSLKQCEFMTLIKIQGKSHKTTDEDDIFTWIENLNTTSRAFLSPHVDMLSYVIRRSEAEYPDGKFDNYFTEELDRKYKKKFIDTENNTLMVNDLYLCIVYKPYGSDFLSGMRKQGAKGREAIAVLHEESAKELDAITEKLVSALSSYNCRVCGVYEESGAGGAEAVSKPVYYSEPLEVMAYVFNGRKVRVPLTKERLSNTMVQSQVKFSMNADLGIRRTPEGHEYIGICGISDYDPNTWPGQFDLLLESDFPFVMVNSFVPVTDRSAKSFLKNHQKFLRESNDVGESQIREIDEALDQITSGRFGMGHHHFSLMITDSDVKTVTKRMEAVASDLSKHGIIVKPHSQALEAAFWAQFPSNRKYRPKPKPATTLNFWCFSSFHNFMRGKVSGNPWGSSVAVFKTESKTPINFNFHESPLNQDSFGDRPVGHTGIFGKTGAGKTTLFCFLLAMATKYKPNSVIFDKDRGMENLIRSIGGVYNSVTWGVPTGWNPFQMEPTDKNVYFLKEWVKDLAIKTSGMTLTKQDNDEIDLAVDTIMKEDKALRSLRHLKQMLPDGDDNRTSVGGMLEKWITGDLKWIFNNAEDNLALSRGIYGFDTTSFLDNDTVREPILKYLMHRGNALIDGITPFILGFEECWKLTKDAFFVDLIQDKLKTIRKENGIVVFSTQEPNDVLSSAIGATFASSLSTIICLRNDKANEQSYKLLKMSDVEISIIKRWAEDEYKFIIKQGAISSIAEFDFSEYKDEEMQILSSDKAKADIALSAMNETSTEPKEWLPVYYDKIKKIKEGKKYASI